MDAAEQQRLRAIGVKYVSNLLVAADSRDGIPRRGIAVDPPPSLSLLVTLGPLRRVPFPALPPLSHRRAEFLGGAAAETEIAAVVVVVILERRRIRADAIVGRGLLAVAARRALAWLLLERSFSESSRERNGNVAEMSKSG